MHYSLLLSQLLHELDEIDGRKKFQKIVHILKCAGAPFDERFEYAHFGPYSETLRSELDSLCSHKYISEEANGKSYLFKKGERFNEIEGEEFLSSSPNWSVFAKALNAYSPRKLESLSTTLFLLQHGYDEDVLDAKFSELKSHLVQHFDWAKEAAKKITSEVQNWTALPSALQTSS